MSGKNLIEILENRNRIRVRQTDGDDEFFPASDVTGKFAIFNVSTEVNPFNLSFSLFSNLLC